MDHYYKYEGLSEEDRNGLIPFMHVPEALKLDPEDSGYQDDTQPNKASPGGIVGSARPYQRKTRDVYTILAQIYDDWQEIDERDSWEKTREQLLELRQDHPEIRYSYRKRRIKINTQ